MAYENQEKSPRPRMGQNVNYQSGRNVNKNDKNSTQSEAERFFTENLFKEEWITNEATRETIAYVEKVGKFMKEKNLSSSQIRNVYGEMKRIEMKGYEEEKSSFFLLKPKVAYALGRDSKNQGLKLFQLIFNKSWSCVSDEKTYKNLCNLFEAIIAFHKSYGGK